MEEEIDIPREMKATLRFISQTLSAEEITTIIGKAPSSTVIKGALISSRSPVIKLRDYHMWILKSELPPSAEMQEHLEIFLDFIESKSEIIQLLLNDCEIDIICSYFSHTKTGGGYYFTSDFIKRLSAYPIELRFDIY